MQVFRISSGSSSGTRLSSSYTTSKEETMKIQIITFQLNGIDEEAYNHVCDELAPAFAAVPGLQAKLWLADRDTNTYGGVYIFTDAGAQAAFAGSDLFAAVASNPNLAGVNSRAFDVLAGPTTVTGGDRLAAERAPA
jgi:Putative mono-oxygenase ydhR